MKHSEEYLLKIKQNTIVWFVTVIVLFVVMIVLGLLMRANQSGVTSLQPDLFYAIMTLHGLGMVGTLFVAGFAATCYIAVRYVRLNLAVLWVAYVLNLLGVVGLLVAVLIGKFAPGWYLLYPIQYIKTWPDWTIGVANLSLMIMGSGWLIGQLELVRAISAKFGFSNMFGWQYFTEKAKRVEIPPFIMITSVSVTAGTVATISGAVFLMLVLIRWINPDLNYSPLLMKNYVFLFGHTLVNITMYLGIALVYELLPEYTKRAWKMNKIVAISWNTSFVSVLIAYFHHLYMDFSQPLPMQYIGQIFSYASSVPATVVTVFGVIGQAFRSTKKWDYVPLSFILGIMGWIVGGLAAVVDSTIRVNTFFHNTLWVPAHFHTYFLVGFVTIIFGFMYYMLGSTDERRAKFALSLNMIGGYGFLSMFYFAGMMGVPRRYAVYSAISNKSLASTGAATAGMASVFVILILVAYFTYAVTVLFDVGKAWNNRKD